MKRNIAVVSIVSLIIDQIIKIICLCFLKSTFIIIPNFLSLIFATNDGVAFSMLSGNKIIIILISILLTFILIYYIYEDYIKKDKKDSFKEVLYGLLLGGVLGNLLDRIIHGFVIDYISFNIFGYYFPIFNLADILITVSIIILLIYYFFESKMVNK